MVGKLSLQTTLSISCEIACWTCEEMHQEPDRLIDPAARDLDEGIPVDTRSIDQVNTAGVTAIIISLL